MKKLLSLSVGLLAAISPAFAQQRSMHLGDPSMSIEKRQSLAVGRSLDAFVAQGLDGSIVNNRKLAGKVSLLLFWYPSLSSSNMRYNAGYLHIDTIAALQKQYKDFQIISLLADTSGLSVFRSQNPDASIFLAANLNSHGQASVLSMGNGMPSCLLIDREGKVARASWLGFAMHQDAMADKIKDLMMP